VTQAALIEELRQETLGRIVPGEVVLLVQDTTSVDFSGRAGTAGLGTLENQHSRGLFRGRCQSLVPHLPSALVLLPYQWMALLAFITRSAPHYPPTLRQTVHWIAQLSGFMGRKRDGDPGVKVLWRGESRLQDIADTLPITHPKDVGNG
jgi:hypothetical protein